MGHRAFEFLYLVSEIVVIILYMFCTEYSESTQGQDFFKVQVIGTDEDLWQLKMDTWESYVPSFCKKKSYWDDIKECTIEAKPSSGFDEMGR